MARKASKARARKEEAEGAAAARLKSIEDKKREEEHPAAFRPGLQEQKHLRKEMIEREAREKTEKKKREKEDQKALKKWMYEDKKKWKEWEKRRDEWINIKANEEVETKRRKAEVEAEEGWRKEMNVEWTKRLRARQAREMEKAMRDWEKGGKEELSRKRKDDLERLRGRRRICSGGRKVVGGGRRSLEMVSRIARSCYLRDCRL
jgi:hypothetical protein